MTQVADFIKDTLGLLQVVDVKQPVKDADMQTGIRFLNRVCGRIEADGISMGWSPVSSPSDDLPLPEEAELGVMYALAMTLAAQWGVTPLPTVVAGARGYMEDLVRDQMVATPIQPLLDVPTPGYTYANSLNGPVVG